MAILFYSNEDEGDKTLNAIRSCLPTDQIENWPISTDLAAIKYAIAWNVPDRFFDGLTNLRAIFSLGAGVDHLLKHPALPDVPLIRLSDAGMADKIADYVLYGVIRNHRRFDLYEQQQAASVWQPQLEIDTPNYRVGVMGMGVIGSRIAQRLTNSGYNVCCWKRTQSTESGISTFHGSNQLPAFLDSLNALICVLPLTQQTHEIINQSLLEALPPGAHFINVGRGDHVNETDLLASLDSGHLASAMLDVVVSEPLPSGSRLWSHPSVLLTPHIAGPTQAELSARQIAESINQFESGKTPPGIVDRKTGY